MQLEEYGPAAALCARYGAFDEAFDILGLLAQQRQLNAEDFIEFIINPTIEKNGIIISPVVQYVITQLKLDKYANIDFSLVSRYTFTKATQEQIASINEMAKANEDIKALNAAIDRYKQISERNNKILNSFTITETNS
jgi:hypothetical protein